MRRNHLKRIVRFLMAMSASILPIEQPTHWDWSGRQREDAQQLLVIEGIPPWDRLVDVQISII